MSTGTSQQPVAAQPVPVGRRTAVVVGVIAALSVLGALGVVYASMEVNGADLRDPRGWVLILLIALVPGVLAAWAVSLGVAATGRRAPRLAWIAPIGVLLMMAAVTGMAALGGHVYDTHQANIAAACTSQRVAVLETLRQYGPDAGTAVGLEDGTCAIFLTYPGEDGQAVMAALVGRINADGWTTTDTAWDARTFTRNGDAVRVAHFYSEDGQTAVRVVVLDR